MPTIKDNLIKANVLLRGKTVKEHLQACDIVFFTLLEIGFDKDVLRAIAYYHAFLVNKHQDAEKVGFFKKLFGLLKAVFYKRLLIYYLDKCDNKKFGDGDLYIKQIFLSIRKALK